MSFKKRKQFLDFDKFQKEPTEIKFKNYKQLLKIYLYHTIPQDQKKVLNLIDGFQIQIIKKCTLGGCIFEEKKVLFACI